MKSKKPKNEELRFYFFFRTKRIYLVWFVAGVFSALFLESLSRSWRTKVGSVHSTKKNM